MNVRSVYNDKRNRFFSLRHLNLLGVFLLGSISVGTANVVAEAPLELSLESIQKNLDFVWVLHCAALVFLMQGGFMCLESGLSEAKNSINVAIKNMADFVLAASAFWIIGFGLMFGISHNGWVGTSDFVLDLKDPWQAIFFVFQCVFVGTAATITSGAIAGRTRFISYLIISAIISVVIYPVFGHWAWGSLYHEGTQGWLEAKGFIDFAGSTVVHSIGGWVALAAAIVIGPRKHKFNENREPQKIHGHSLTIAFLGSFLLFFGWFGFNCGSTLSATPAIAGIAMNTMLSASFGCVACSICSWVFSEENLPEGEMVVNGLLAGLVAITAGCAAVTPLSSVLIGTLAGILCYFSLGFIEKKLKIDDVVGAIAVHGVCGAWGTLAAGLFATDAALNGVDRGFQVFVQLLGIASAFAWAFGIGYLLIKFFDTLSSMRVSPEDEEAGLNVAEHGASSTLIDIAKSLHEISTHANFGEQIKVHGSAGTEMGELAIGFNKLVDAINESLEEAQHQKNVASAEASRARSASEEARQEKDLAQQALHAAEAAQEHSKGIIAEVSGLLNRIKDVAKQTDLLALNANIEAASAGEAGRSFSVVATEVQHLAKRVSDITEEMRKKIASFEHDSQRHMKGHFS